MMYTGSVHAKERQPVTINTN